MSRYLDGAEPFENLFLILKPPNTQGRGIGGEPLTNVKIKMLQEPKVSRPILVCGLPGSGYVGKLAVDHLVKELDAKPFGEVYSYGFPPQVLISPEGTADLMKNILYVWNSPDSPNDLILYTGDSQPISPDADYEVADRVLDVAERLGVKRVFALAAYITGGFVEKPKVYGTATDDGALDELKSYDVIMMKEGSITGMNGLLIGLAKLRGMLLGETSGYIIDANASKAVLSVFTKIIGIKVDMTSLTERAKETEGVIKTLEQIRRRGLEKAPEAVPEKDKELGYIS